ncbi:response regulator [Phenylobacterium deserti]|nr:response regulator [Phenylobacterium deserti]
MALRRLRAWVNERLGGRELQAARDETRRANARLRDLLDSISEGVVILDAGGRYVLWNQAYADIYHRSADLFRPGASLEETLRVGVARGDYPDAAGREDAWIAERIGKLMAATGERSEQRLSDGRWLLVEERRTTDGGVIGLRVDITDFKQQAAALAEALAHAEAANRAKAEFLADMSHEIRTPLNGVSGLSRILEATELDANQSELVAELRGSIRELEGVARHLLDHGDASPEEEPTPPTIAASAGDPVRILLADDNATNRKVIELMLGAAEAQVTSVEDGAQAVEAWRRDRFDLVLMDLRMPVMDGLSAIRTIRAEEQAAGRARTGVVVLSANTSAEDREASARAGADGHIGKPIQVEELLAAIGSAMAAAG